MPKQNNTQELKKEQLPVKTYDAGYLWDAHSIAEADLAWCDTAISDLKSKFKDHKEYMIKAYGAHEAHFAQIETFLEMYEYLIDDRLKYHKGEAESYKAEWNTNEKAVTL